jgi:dimethylhistidine N-methyltransferase
MSMTIAHGTDTAVERFAAEVRAGLSKPGQRELPSKYLYDAVGSALFETISVLPEYGLTRAGDRLLRRHATAMMRPIPGPVLIAELGSGSGRNTRWLLEAIAQRAPVTYCPIDISSTALAHAQRELGRIESVSIVGYEAEYLDGLRAATARRAPDQSLLVLFLGSTIGNFDRPAGEAFLAEVRTLMRPGDRLLLSTDLEKPVEQLLAAYDDPVGVTAAFNLNLLARINRELGGDFILSHYRHLARWNARERRVEMHLCALETRTVRIAAADLTVTLEQGETIWTESSHKYLASDVVETGIGHGMLTEGQWIDREWPFAHTMLRVD